MPRLLHTDWPAHLWIVRHGQSAGNVARDAAELAGDRLIELEHRDADTPLSALGERQSVALAQWFSEQPAWARPTVFFSSPFVRAYQTCLATATALGHEGSEIAIDERLREKEFGILDRYTVPGIKATFPELAEQRALVGKFYFRPPGGELVRCDPEAAQRAGGSQARSRGRACPHRGPSGDRELLSVSARMPG